MSPEFTILPIVEGDGEVQAMPILVRRISGEIFGRYDIGVRNPWRVPRSKIVRREDVEPVLRFLSRAAPQGQGGALLILDLDDDPCALELAANISSINSTDMPLEVVVACKEFEAWFLGSVSSLRTHKAVRDDASYEGDPELPRDAKGRLEILMEESYKETLHQSSFSQLLDLEQARDSCRSFARLISAIGSLLGAK